MTKIQIIRKFVKELAGEKVVVRPETFWGACGNKTVLVDVTALTPVPDIDMLQDDNAFRTNFLRQGGKQNREFSNIVLIRAPTPALARVQNGIEENRKE